MCNLYSLSKGQQAIRDLTKAMCDETGNLPPMPGIFPDYPAPIVRNQPGGRQLMMARWGMPSPLFVLQGKTYDPSVTNIRNVSSPHWRRWLGVAHRCVVPFTSFAEPEPRPLANGKKPPVWFALDETRPLARFAGFWTQWTSVRGQGRRGNSKYFCFPDDRAKQGSRRNSSEGHAGDFNLN